MPFELEEVEIDGDAELEARYREWLPVVEIDGERTLFVWASWMIVPLALLGEMNASCHSGRS